MTGYKILSYVLLPIAAFFALVALFGLLLALGNLSALLSVFLAGCTAIYLFLAFSFVQRVLVQGRSCPARRYDWIRVNAFVAGFFGMLMIMQGVAFLYNPEMQQMLTDEMMAMPQAKALGADTLKATLKGVLLVFVGVGTLVVLHVLITLRKIREYRNAFVD